MTADAYDEEGPMKRATLSGRLKWGGCLVGAIIASGCDSAGGPSLVTGDDGKATPIESRALRCQRGRNHPLGVSLGDDVTTPEGTAVTLTATVSDGDCDALQYQWSFQPGFQPHGLPVSCTFSAPNAATTSFVCDNDSPVTVTVTVQDRPPHRQATDSMMVLVTDVVAQVRFLSPAEGLVVKRGTPLAATAEVIDPGRGDITMCMITRDDDFDTSPIIRPVLQPDGRLLCNFFTETPSTYLTVLTGMRRLSITADGVGADEPSRATRNIVVWAPLPTDLGEGQGTIAGSGGPASFSFSVRYASEDAAVPSGPVQFDDEAAGMHLVGTALDWFVVSRVRFSTLFPDHFAIAGHGMNGDRACDFLLLARAPKPFDYDAGARGGDLRMRIQCGSDVYDTNPSEDHDADTSPLSPLGSGTLHIDYVRPEI
jgi:hypothetical protein